MIVPVRNGIAALRAFLTALSVQTLPASRFEAIVAVDGWESEPIRRLAAEFQGVSVVAGPPQNSYAARNRAANGARAPVLAFSDSDCRPTPTWLEAGLAAISTETAGLVAGAIEPVVPTYPTVWSLLDAESTYDQEHAVRSGHAMAANLFVGRELFERLRGFDATLPSGGDYEFVERARATGARLAYAPEVVVAHPTSVHAREFLSRFWFRIRWQQARVSRAGTRTQRSDLALLVPVVGPYAGRRKRGLSFRLDRRRFASSAVKIGITQEVAAVGIVYALLYVVRPLAALSGWRASRNAT